MNPFLHADTFGPLCSSRRANGEPARDQVCLKGTQRPLLAPEGPTQTIEALDLVLKQSLQASAHPCGRITALRLAFRASGERGQRPAQETGPGAERRTPGGVTAVGSSRAPPVAMFEPPRREDSTEHRPLLPASLGRAVPLEKGSQGLS